MIQDAHPMRSGVPDCYVAKYKIDVVVAAATWTVNMDRFPSGFGAPGAGQNAFSATGIGLITFPPGMKVRNAHASVSAPTTTVADQRCADVVAINEAAGTASIAISDRAVPALANPVINSIIWVELTLETV
jgi:hypothetical protein